MEPEQEINLPRLARKKRTGLTPAGLLLVALFFLLCAGLGFLCARLLNDPIVPRSKEGEEQPLYSSQDVLNVLLLGIDQRENEPARADTIILASINVRDKTVYLLSIPRDTRVDIPGKGVTRKINYAHAVGGAELTVKTVENFLRLPVHYYVETNFAGFSSIIDLLGGITLNVEERMYLPEEGIDLKAGLQKLNGHDALSYVRWRGDGQGDIGRIERQQKFFRALADQALTFSTIWKIPDLLEELNKHVETDMPLPKMVSLANRFRDVKSIRLEASIVPGRADDTSYGASYWIADQKALTGLLEKIYGQKTAQAQN